MQINFQNIQILFSQESPNSCRTFHHHWGDLIRLSTTRKYTYDTFYQRREKWKRQDKDNKVLWWLLALYCIELISLLLLLCKQQASHLTPQYRLNPHRVFSSFSNNLIRQFYHLKLKHSLSDVWLSYWFSPWLVRSNSKLFFK